MVKISKSFEQVVTSDSQNPDISTGSSSTPRFGSLPEPPPERAAVRPDTSTDAGVLVAAAGAARAVSVPHAAGVLVAAAAAARAVAVTSAARPLAVLVAAAADAESAAARGLASVGGCFWGSGTQGDGATS